MLKVLNELLSQTYVIIFRYSCGELFGICIIHCLICYLITIYNYETNRQVGNLFRSNLLDRNIPLTRSEASLFGGVLIMALSLFSTLICSGLPSKTCSRTPLPNFSKTLFETLGW